MVGNLVTNQGCHGGQTFADILRLTLDAWNEMPTKVFESAWVITGYFEATHFETYRHLTPAEGHQEAYKVM